MAKSKQTGVKNVWVILSNKSIVDPRTSMVSIIDIVERIEVGINLGGLPKDMQDSFHEKGFFSKAVQIPTKLVLSSLWQIPAILKQRKLLLTIHLHNPEGKHLGDSSISFIYKSPNGFQRVFMDLPFFIIDRSGLYNLKINLKNKEKVLVRTELPIKVDIKATMGQKTS